MSRTKIIAIAVMVVGLLGALVLPGLAQSPVTAEVDRTYLSTDELLTLVVSMDTSAGDADSAPQLPALGGFEVLNTGSGKQVSLVNGEMRVADFFQYTLHPTQSGTLVIDPITVQIGGQTYQTQPITIEVTQGTGQMRPSNPALPGFGSLPGFGNLPGFGSLPGMGGAPGNPGSGLPQGDPASAPAELNGQTYFVEAEIDNPTPYQGEQVLYTFRFYQAESLFDQPSYEPPAFTGFWSDQEPQQTEYALDVNGRPYRVTELTTAIFPTVVGDLTIEPARLVIPDDFFTRGGTLSTQPIPVSVQPLPANAPATFSGAVGQFEMQSAVDKTTTEVNDTVTLTVQLNGRGNLTTAPDPVWEAGPEWRAFDSQATVDTQFSDGLLRGTKTVEYVLVPTRGGDHLLPAIEYTYFDPATESYVTITTEPIIVTVAGEAAPVAPAANDAGSPLTTAPVGLELRPQKPAVSSWSNTATLPARGGYWLLWLLPLALIAGSIGWSRYSRHRQATADVRRSSQAAKKARLALQAAHKQADADSEVGRVLLTYISEKLNRPVAGLTQTGLGELLAAQGVDAALIARVQTILTLGEMGRFAPRGLELAGGDLLQETAAVIDALDEALAR